VTIGSYPCVVEESSENYIMCHIDPQNSMDVGIREIVTLIVYNLGTAINTVPNEFDRRENTQDVHVSIASDKCDVQYSNKTHIICMTSAHSPSGWAPVHVSIRNIGMAKL
ncbi:hypothetical protein A6R68_07688, partial [Neotoma lepida]